MNENHEEQALLPRGPMNCAHIFFRMFNFSGVHIYALIYNVSYSKNQESLEWFLSKSHSSNEVLVYVCGGGAGGCPARGRCTAEVTSFVPL